MVVFELYARAQLYVVLEHTGAVEVATEEVMVVVAATVVVFVTTRWLLRWRRRRLREERLRVEDGCCEGGG